MQSAATNDAARRDRRAVILAAGLAAFWLAVIAYAAHAALPFNPLRLPLEDKVRMWIFLPEGWSFFTRNAREADLFPFVKRSGSWTPAALTPHAEPHNWGGISRYARAQGIEMGLLVEKMTKEALFKPCKQSPEVCLAASAPARTFVNRSPRPTLCGQVAVVRQEPVPWAWSRSKRPIVMPSEIAVLEVSCP